MKKKLFSLMLALVLMVCFTSVPALADTAENPTFAYLMYADSSWTNQYWGTEQDTDVRELMQTSLVPVNTPSASILPEQRR